MNHKRTLELQRPQVSAHQQLTLSTYFIQPGMHAIDASDQLHGRRIVTLALDTLGMYSDVGMLTLPCYGVPSHYRDLYGDMDAWGALSVSNGMIDEYLLSIFSCDCLIIECSQELMSQPWYGTFEQLLHEYAITKSIAIIQLFYEDDHADYW